MSHHPGLRRKRLTSLVLSDIDILPDLLEEPSSPDASSPPPEQGFPEKKESDNTADVELGRIPIPPPQLPPDKGEKSKYVVHADKEPYDYLDHRTTARPTDSLESTGLLIKGCVGAGFLGIHEAYIQYGIWTSILATIILGLYVTYCMHILVRSAQTLYKRLHIPSLTYSDLAEAACAVGPCPTLRKYSKCFRFAVDLAIVVDLFGTCCICQILISRIVKELTVSQETNEGDLELIRFYILTLLVPILIICMITSLKYLASFSLIADLFIVITVIATVAYGVQSSTRTNTVEAWNNVTSLFGFSGTLLFSLEGIGVALPIENNMRDPSKYPVVLWSGMSTVIIFLILMGYFGSRGYAHKTVLSTTLNHTSEIFPLVQKCMMNIMLFVTFALNFWTPVNIIWHYLRQWHNPQKYWLWERIYRVIFVIIITSVSAAFPYVVNLMQLVGAVCLSFIGFIFPATIDLLVLWETLGKYKWRLWTNMFTMATGLALLVAASYSIRLNVNLQHI